MRRAIPVYRSVVVAEDPFPAGMMYIQHQQEVARWSLLKVADGFRMVTKLAADSMLLDAFASAE